MNEDARDSALAERGLAGADQSVASFEEEAVTLVKRLQHFLHEFPTAVPFIVLIIGILIFSATAGGKFFAPFNLSLVLQQVTIIGILATIAAALAKQHVNLDAVLQEPGYPKHHLPFVITVEACPEAALMAALHEIGKADWHAEAPLALPMLFVENS